ncbi:hypothetical protein AVEN_94689-1 [Araneus ventricosus]|uniref:Uncharacterized protein n=1 Tax=Araneus ventricosus TaxID=182803 RepID=A0A4Y2I806_ARAVE|nr:hypothetical protein AVEN_94689-1 [Araneus ventricosus]
MITQAWQLEKEATIPKSFHKIVQKRREDDSQQTENFLRLSMASKGVKKFRKRAFSSGWTLKTNIQVFKSLMMKLYKPLIPHRTLMILPMRTRTLRIICNTEGFKALTTALKYLEQRSDVTPIDILLLKNWCDRAATDKFWTFATKYNRLF